ncbi:MAG: helix-turn-helix domain-containing protein [Gammaproteobacteria bacterium]|nr:helix-turn-helix domain-containing protein [Gammaproteobacteria bacterium]
MAFNTVRNMFAGLWVVILYLTVSGMVDLLIAHDFWKHEGLNLNQIVKWAPIVTVMMIVIFAIWQFRVRRKARLGLEQNKVGDTETARATVARMSELMKVSNLQRDPDLSVTKIAKALGISPREVSQSVNLETGQNVSAYINNYRIKDVCKLLTETDSTITEVLYQAGFNTKSNFNREFKRVMGTNPSVWRKTNRNPTRVEGT